MNENPPQKVESREEEPAEIKRITPDDWQLYRDLRVESLKADPDSFEKDDEAIKEAENFDENYWRDLIAGTEENKFRLYGIYKDGQIISTASISLEPKDEYNLSYNFHGTRPTIDRVYTRPEHRDSSRDRSTEDIRNRYGLRIMQKILEVAKEELRLPYVYLDVNNSNDSAIGFYYNKLNFQKTGKFIQIKDRKTGGYTLNQDGTKRVFVEMYLNLSDLSFFESE